MRILDYRRFTSYFCSSDVGVLGVISRISRPPPIALGTARALATFRTRAIPQPHAAVTCLSASTRAAVAVSQRYNPVIIAMEVFNRIAMTLRLYLELVGHVIATQPLSLSFLMSSFSPAVATPTPTPPIPDSGIQIYFYQCDPK